MISWTWTIKEVEPEDILDGASALKGPAGSLALQLAPNWVPAATYLEWAKAAFHRGKDDGWDSAAGWAKRAVCRQMDCMLIHNHLYHFLGRNYGDKSEYLLQLKVPGLSILRNLVIDPRNDIEHAYKIATESQAKVSLEIAELFLAATNESIPEGVLIDCGLDINSNDSGVRLSMGDPSIQVNLSQHHPPFLLITGYPDTPRATILQPRDEVASVCELKKFKVDQVLKLNDTLEQPENGSPSNVRWSFGYDLFHQLTTELKL